MNGKISIDSAGRVVIPKRAREALGIGPGDMLDMTFDSDGLTLRPERQSISLEKERGVWVFRAGIILSQEEANDALDLLRAQRTLGQV
jgi:AbrB family looped-hinge helix DNA binding protein